MTNNTLKAISERIREIENTINHDRTITPEKKELLELEYRLLKLIRDIYSD